MTQPLKDRTKTYVQRNLYKSNSNLTNSTITSVSSVENDILISQAVTTFKAEYLFFIFALINLNVVSYYTC